MPAPPDVQRMEAAHPLAPRYWRNETSGALAHAIERYLSGDGALTVRDVSLIRAYFVQWIDAPLFDANSSESKQWPRTLALLRSDARRLASAACITAWLLRATEEGIDPL